MNRAMKVVLCGGAVVALSAVAAYAQTTDVAGNYTSFLQLFAGAASKWQSTLTTYALRLFWLLAGIDFVLIFIPLALRGSELGEVVGELVRFILTIGFFYYMVEEGPTWANDIVTSLRDAGARAANAGASLSPGNVLLQGFKIAANVTLHLNLFSPGIGIAFIAAWVVLILSFAYMAAIIAVTLIESYIIIYGAVIFLGLGGSRFTRDYAITVMRYALAVGAKLFTITLIVNLLTQAFAEWATAWDNTLTSATG